MSLEFRKFEPLANISDLDALENTKTEIDQMSGRMNDLEGNNEKNVS